MKVWRYSHRLGGFHRNDNNWWSPKYHKSNANKTFCLANVRVRRVRPSIHPEVVHWTDLVFCLATWVHHLDLTLTKLYSEGAPCCNPALKSHYKYWAKSPLEGRSENEWTIDWCFKTTHCACLKNQKQFRTSFGDTQWFYVVLMLSQDWCSSCPPSHPAVLLDKMYLFILLCGLIVVSVPISPQYNTYFNQTWKHRSCCFKSNYAKVPVNQSKWCIPVQYWNSFREHFFWRAFFLGNQYPNAIISDVKHVGCVITTCMDKADRCNCNGSSSPKLFYLKRPNWFCPMWNSWKSLVG